MWRGNTHGFGALACNAMWAVNSARCQPRKLIFVFLELVSEGENTFPKLWIDAESACEVDEMFKRDVQRGPRATLADQEDLRNVVYFLYIS
jgi:hypothetical protein